MAAEFCSQSLQGIQADALQNVFNNQQLQLNPTMDFQSFSALTSAVQSQEQNRHILINTHGRKASFLVQADEILLSLHVRHISSLSKNAFYTFPYVVAVF